MTECTVRNRPIIFAFRSDSPLVNKHSLAVNIGHEHRLRVAMYTYTGDASRNRRASVIRHHYPLPRIILFISYFRYGDGCDGLIMS